MFYFSFMPDKYASEILKIGTMEGNDKAMSNIQLINAGERIPPRKNADADYVSAYNQFLQSPNFKQLDPEIQRLHVEHIRGTVDQTKIDLKDQPEKKEESPSQLSQIVNRLRGGKNAKEDGEEVKEASKEEGYEG